MCAKEEQVEEREYGHLEPFVSLESFDSPRASVNSGARSEVRYSDFGQLVYSTVSDSEAPSDKSGWMEKIGSAGLVAVAAAGAVTLS
jgi:hypothetical protein